MGGSISSNNQHLVNQLGVNFPEGVKFVGFENKSNICYANSTIQCLFYCDAFRERVAKAKQIEGVPSGENPILIIQDLFKQLSDYKKRTGCIATKKLMNFVRKKNEMFKGDSHQDCHEFLIWFLNEIDDVLIKSQKNKDKKKKNQQQDDKAPPKMNWLQEIFQGKLVTQTKCSVCENITEREEPFFDISLDIEHNASLSYCLKHMCEPEKLEGEDKFMCDKCEKLQDASKRMLIKNYPDTLIIHLKRFKYDEKYVRMMKLNWKISFPIDIKLKANYKEDSPEEIYDLYGIVLHLGQGQQYGHYQSVIKIKNNWYLFDDESITMFKEMDFFNIFGSNHHSACAYMLFYQKREEKKK